jgi:hypothetical protein
LKSERIVQILFGNETAIAQKLAEELSIGRDRFH